MALYNDTPLFNVYIYYNKWEITIFRSFKSHILKSKCFFKALFHRTICDLVSFYICPVTF